MVRDCKSFYSKQLNYKSAQSREQDAPYTPPDKKN
jgi:hypothetical protein